MFTLKKRLAIKKGISSSRRRPFFRVDSKSTFGDTRNVGDPLTQDDGVHAAFEVRKVQVFALGANTQCAQLFEAYALTPALFTSTVTNPGCVMSNCT